MAETVDELVKQQQALMAEESKIAQDFKKKKAAIQQKIDKAMAVEAVKGQLAGLSDETRLAVLAELGQPATAPAPKASKEN
jgi:hypothetical protein